MNFILGASGNWIEIAYGTSSGTVRVIVQHPETVGHGPQLFQTFTVHQSSVTKVRALLLFTSYLWGNACCCDDTKNDEFGGSHVGAINI